ncbi:MAG: Gfo/Idh/MocA family oxidoreductase [Clostridiaceae bacterium]|nr:Gfo/Idh/MocA family oxidoreductase [Clostridiaceae bacterium]
MKRTVNFAIIGCGMISRFHIKAIQAIDDAKLVGVYDQFSEFSQKTAREYQTKAYDTYESLLADRKIDAVSICTPSGLHAEQSLQAIQAGKHVLIEKPIALCLEDSDKISALAREKGVLVGVVSQLRFSRAVKTMKQAIQEGVLGKIVSADLYMKYFRSQQYYDQNPWRGTWAMDGGGALMNQGIHGVDLLRYIMGPLKSISACAGTLTRHIEVEDTLAAVVEYANGALGVIQAMTSVYPGYPRRLEINGERGTIILEEDTLVKWAVEGQPSCVKDEDATRRKSHNDPGEIGVDGHIEQYKNFISAVQGDAALLIDDLEGRKTLEIIMKAYESSRQKKTVYFNE